MPPRQLTLCAAAGALLLGACQTTPAEPSGYLSSYDGIASPGGAARAAVAHRRDDPASDAVVRVHIEPARMTPGVGADLDDGERLAVLHEVDRQICFEMSERFEIAAEPANDAAIVRTYVVRVDPTGRIGSGVSAVANFFNPVPVLNLRTPGTTGGLSVESEMLAPLTGQQIAAVTWSRDAQVIGTDSPSLSRIGDALQFAEPMADAVAAGFSSEARPAGDVPEPDPCERFGSRRDFVRTAGGVVVGFATGLYVPEIEHAGPADEE